MAKIPIRQKALIVLFVVAVAAWGIGNLRVHLLTRELEPIAQRHKDAMLEDWDAVAEENLAHSSVVTMPYFFLGEPSAKLTIYVHTPDAEEGLEFGGLEILLAKREGEWVELESGMCYEYHCVSAAKHEFGIE